MLKHLPNESKSVTYRTIIRSPHIGPRKVYLTIGFYDDGLPGSLELRTEKAGTTAAGALAAWSLAVSRLLQLGEVDRVLSDFSAWGCEPSGQTTDTAIHFVAGPIDWAIKRLAMVADKKSDTLPT